MACTLLIESSPHISEIYQLNLWAFVGLQTRTVRTLEEALQELASRSFQLIIARAQIGPDDVALRVAEFLSAHGRQIPLLVIGRARSPGLPARHWRGSLDLKGVVKGAAEALGVTAQSMAQKKVDDFFEIPAHLLHGIHCPLRPVYLRDSFDELRQVAGPARAIDPTQLPAGGTVLVAKLDRLEIVNQITAELVARLALGELNADEQLQAQALTYELICQKLRGIGVHADTIELARRSLDALIANVKKYPRLKALVDRLLRNQTSYHFQHTQIVTYVALHIVRNIDWGTAEQEHKVAFICFFHDIALETDQQARVRSAEELRCSGLDARETALVERHAQLAAELLQKYPHAPMGADQIIRQHHGVLNGLGFSEHFGANLSPMTIVFIVAEEATRILTRAGSAHPRGHELCRELRVRFPSARFKKCIDVLETLSL